MLRGGFCALLSIYSARKPSTLCPRWQVDPVTGMRIKGCPTTRRNSGTPFGDHIDWTPPLLGFLSLPEQGEVAIWTVLQSWSKTRTKAAARSKLHKEERAPLPGREFMERNCGRFRLTDLQHNLAFANSDLHSLFVCRSPTFLSPEKMWVQRTWGGSREAFAFASGRDRFEGLLANADVCCGDLQ